MEHDTPRDLNGRSNEEPPHTRLMEIYNHEQLKTPSKTCK